METMWKWVSSLVLLLLPADSTEDPPTEPAAEPPATEPPTEPAGEPAAEPAAEPEPDMVPRSELDRVEAEHKANVYKEAEELLMRVVPDQYPGPSREPYYGQPQPPGEPETQWDDMSDEQRQNHLRNQNEQLLANQERMQNQSEAERLIDQLEGLKRDEFPEMDVRECLAILSRRPDARIDKLAEISHNRALDHERELVATPAFRERHSLPPLTQENPGGTPAPPTAAPGRTAPRLPGSGPTTTGAQPITTKNARHVLRDRMIAAGLQE